MHKRQMVIEMTGVSNAMQDYLRYLEAAIARRDWDDAGHLVAQLRDYEDQLRSYRRALILTEDAKAASSPKPLRLPRTDDEGVWDLAGLVTFVLVTTSLTVLGLATALAWLLGVARWVLGG